MGGNRQMVVVVCGFPSKTAALRFEWGWTYPQKCTLTTLPSQNRHVRTCWTYSQTCTYVCSQAHQRGPGTARVEEPGECAHAQSTAQVRNRCCGARFRLCLLLATHHPGRKCRYMFELLHITPWNRFPLVIHWLTQVR